MTTLPTMEKPTRARHWVIVFAVTLSIITYIDRVCMSQVTPSIRADLHLTQVQMGWAFSAFAFSYALFEIPGGWLGDWLGPRRVLMRVVVWWSFFTAATGMAFNLGSLVVTQALFGAGEAGCFPNLTKAFTTWLPGRERSRAQGIMWMSARWGGALTPMLVLFVLQFVTWREAFGIFGAIGVVWAVFFYRWFRDNPRDHKSVNAAELALLEGAEKRASGHGNVPWGRFVRSRSVWLLWAQYFCLSWGWYFYITWLPTYLREGRGLKLGEGALLAGMPLLFGGTGAFISGMLLPRLARLAGGDRPARKIMACTGFLGASSLLVLSSTIMHPGWAMLAMAFSSFCNDLVMPTAWNTCMDVGGKYAGTLSGSMNMMGNLAGGFAPVAGGYILSLTHNWNLTLYVSAGIYSLGVICWLLLDPVTPIESES
jgi:MFS transporter, ACS family, glucarate transporter